MSFFNQLLCQENRFICERLQSTYYVLDVAIGPFVRVTMSMAGGLSGVKHSITPEVAFLVPEDVLNVVVLGNN